MLEGGWAASRLDHLQHLGAGAGEAPFTVEQGQDLPGRFGHIPLLGRCTGCRFMALAIAFEQLTG